MVWNRFKTFFRRRDASRKDTFGAKRIAPDLSDERISMSESPLRPQALKEFDLQIPAVDVLVLEIKYVDLDNGLFLFR